MTADDEDAMMPMNEVMPKPSGMVKSCAHSASLGLRANRAKSGSFMIRAAKLPMQLMIDLTTAQASWLPWALFGWCTMGPIPLARAIAQAKKAIAAMGE